MSEAQWREFALHGTRTGKLAVTRSDGAPHVTPVWFTLDEDHVVFTTEATSVKGRALRREPRFALCIDDESPPYSFVLIRAEAQLSEDTDQLLRWATVLGGRYMGAEHAEEFGRRNAIAGEYLVRGRITGVTALAGIAD
ncbi:PPOX class F420-dependent oxidoreductase [Haloactinomyces albus]|uniref:PPOX class probable F420-dependent enzyme n=1 Tax=Haloactinomyces albus TaxID=1352928 RepID=A0AAE3ZHD3_9ACTN|nr:PPOX class F420-dependent oxidoreductase [Haloactinomyces albus]MDR7304050.1 PPOX class probable F420-dependent enzyme [Haloactinomyces albus]